MIDRIRTRTRSRRDIRLFVVSVLAPLVLAAGLIPAGALAQPVATQPVDESATGSDQATVSSGLKDEGFGHYFKMRSPDAVDRPQRLDDAAFVCQNNAVQGVRWVEDWKTVEPAQGEYDFSSLHAAVNAVGALDELRDRPCQILLNLRWKSFKASSNPCPEFIEPWEMRFGGWTCGPWDPAVAEAFADMVAALGAEFDGDVHVQGMVFSEQAISVPANETPNYDPQTYADSLMTIYGACSTNFPSSWCLPSFNFIAEDHSLMRVMAEDLAQLPNICLYANDIWPESTSLYENEDRVYDVLLDYPGCRAGGAENHAYGDAPGGGQTGGAPDDYPDSPKTVCAGPTPLSDRACTMEEIFQFAVRGTWGDFDQARAFDSGLCLNGFIIWNYRPWNRASFTGNTTWDVVNVMEDNPYSKDWTKQCHGGGNPLH